MTRDIARVLVLSALSQVAAFGKSILIAYYFGIGAELDGYYLAQAIPAVLAGIVAGILQTGLLTIYAGQVARGEFDAAAGLLTRMLVVLSIVGVAVSIVISLAAPFLVSSIAPEASASVQAAAVSSLRVLAFLLLLNAVVDCLSLALNAHGSFAIAALAPTINALVASALLVALPEWGLGNLIWGTLIGLTAQLALVAFEFHRRRIRLAWGVAVNLRPALLSGAAIVPGLVFANLSGLVPQIIAARLGDGAIATFSIAMRLHGAITQVLAIALSTVLLPHFALAVGRGDYMSIAGQLRKGFPIVALLAVALLMWVGLVGDLFVAVAFERGAFDRTASIAVASVWFWLTVGLLPTVWGLVLAKVLQALQLGSTISAIALFGLSLTIGLGLLLSRAAGLDGLALAVGLGVLGTTIGCTVVTARQLSMSLLLPAKPPRRIARVAAFAAASAATLFGVDLALRAAPRSSELIGVTLSVGIVTALGLRLLLRRQVPSI